jgi:hypothetical protein
METMSQLLDKKISALSTFFYSNNSINDINAISMSSKGAKKSTTKSVGIQPKTTIPKKDVGKKTVTKKKHIDTSSDDSSDSDISSEDEPPKKTKKKVVEKKPKKKPVVSSSDESSSEEDDEEIAVEKIPERDAPVDNVAKLAEGLVAIAEQLAASNANNAKILELLLESLKVRERKDEDDGDLLAVIDDVIARGETITIGSENGSVHRFESVGHLRADSGKLAIQADFAKEIDALRDEHYEEETEIIGA